MARKTAREIAFKLLFEDCFGTSTAAEMFGGLFEEEMKTVDEADLEYIGWARACAKEHAEDNDGIIASLAHGWTVKRMNRVDLSILRLALCEIRFREDVPKGAAINEAVEMAKKYSTDESPAFINGILGAYVKSL